MEELSELFGQLQEDLVKYVRDYKRGFYLEKDLYAMTVTRYHEACRELSRLYPGLSRDSAEYQDAVQKIRDLCCVNPEYFRPQTEEEKQAEHWLTGSSYIMQTSLPEEARHREDLTGADLVLQIGNVHRKGKTEPFYVHMDEKSIPVRPDLYAAEYEGHGGYEGYDKAELSLVIPLENEAKCIIFWKCYPDYGHPRWEQAGALRREDIPMIDTARMLAVYGRQEGSGEVWVR